jgi:hydrogenase maturation protease
VNGRNATLIAGIGNIFLGDDGFGVEVVRRLDRTRLPRRARVADFGISGLHLAYDLLGGYETTILIDAAPRGGEPGTVYLIEAETAIGGQAGRLDAHGMQPDAVLGLLRLLGGDAGRVLVVGCEPACLNQGIGLSPVVAAAVPKAADLVIGLAWGGEHTPFDNVAQSKGMSC